MKLGLEGKGAIVTGASKGIGLSVARALVEEGAYVVAGSRGSSPELDELVASGRATTVSVDLSDAGGPDGLVTSALERGPVDILINNVGAVTPRLDGFLAVTDDDWNHSLNMNLLAAIRTSRAVLPSMVAAGRGCIVTTSSINAHLPDPAVIDYSAAKAALANLSKSLSKEFAASGIRVNSVSPGPVSTPLWLGEGGVAATIAHATGLDALEVARRAADDAATGRFTTPDEVASLIVFLASDHAGNITGADYIIDGGLLKSI